VAYLISENIRRRHLNAGQRAIRIVLAYPEPAQLKRLMLEISTINASAARSSSEAVGTGTGGKGARLACGSLPARPASRSAVNSHPRSQRRPIHLPRDQRRRLLFKANLLAFWPDQARSTRTTCYNWECKSRVRSWGWRACDESNPPREPPRRAALAQIAALSRLAEQPVLGHAASPAGQRRAGLMALSRPRPWRS
jgi:hypothetical protein